MSHVDKLRMMKVPPEPTGDNLCHPSKLELSFCGLHVGEYALSSIGDLSCTVCATCTDLEHISYRSDNNKPMGAIANVLGVPV